MLVVVPKRTRGIVSALLTGEGTCRKNVSRRSLCSGRVLSGRANTLTKLVMSVRRRLLARGSFFAMRLSRHAPLHRRTHPRLEVNPSSVEWLRTATQQGCHRRWTMEWPDVAGPPRGSNSTPMNAAVGVVTSSRDDELRVVVHHDRVADRGAGQPRRHIHPRHLRRFDGVKFVTRNRRP